MRYFVLCLLLVVGGLHVSHGIGNNLMANMVTIWHVETGTIDHYNIDGVPSSVQIQLHE